MYRGRQLERRDNQQRKLKRKGNGRQKDTRIDLAMGDAEMIYISGVMTARKFLTIMMVKVTWEHSWRRGENYMETLQQRASSFKFDMAEPRSTYQSLKITGWTPLNGERGWQWRSLSESWNNYRSSYLETRGSMPSFWTSFWCGWWKTYQRKWEMDHVFSTVNRAE